MGLPRFEHIKPHIGSVAHVNRSALHDDGVARACLEELEARGVLVFPQVNLTDAEQLAFTDKLGTRVNFTKTAPGGDPNSDIYSITLDPKLAELEGLRVVHTVEAAVREVATPDEINPAKRGYKQEHPLVWTHASGRKSLLIGYTADYVVDRPKAEGRALLARLLEWTAQPAFAYRHHWREGDLVVWDNCGPLHRVIPYDQQSGRMMHRTSVAGVEAVR